MCKGIEVSKPSAITLLLKAVKKLSSASRENTCSLEMLKTKQPANHREAPESHKGANSN